MRLLIVHEAPAGGGGVESYLAAVMPALAARGHELAFLHYNPRSQQGPTRLDTGATGAACPMTVASVTDDGLDAAMTRMGAWAPDICFSHNMQHLEVDARLLDLAPVVKMMHGYFGTCIGGQKAHALPRTEPCARTFGTPCLALYLPRRCGQLRPLLMIDQFAWASRQRGLFHRYAHVVVASGHMAREYARHGIEDRRLTTAPLFPTLATVDEPRPLPSAPTVLFAGRMTPLKGGDLLVDAVAVASRIVGSPVRAVFAGDGPERDAWQSRARALGVDATFTGWLTGQALTDAFRSASVVALPSRWPEPFGLVGLEAAMHGVPAVALDVGGIGEWLKDGVNGRLVGLMESAVPRDVFGGTLATLLSSPGDLARFGAGAIATARTMSIDVHLDILERVFSRAIQSRPALA